ncbi:hypothetical protein L1049_020350 [Liquidambar formosana]|uniref:Uncharacterized protein n=1 Tax=Liquidambar formosana TaxID=63359 RepID=A0AAP0S725_LIQFO
MASQQRLSSTPSPASDDLDATVMVTSSDDSPATTSDSMADRYVRMLCGVGQDGLCGYNIKAMLTHYIFDDANGLEKLHTADWVYTSGHLTIHIGKFKINVVARGRWRRRDVFKTLGPGSEAELATVLAFGSLFTAPYKGSELYIDIHEAPSDQRVQSLIENIEYLPFVPEIMSAGKECAFETINAPFLCAQLRLLDGQFKNHWKATFLN